MGLAGVREIYRCRSRRRPAEETRSRAVGGRTRGKLRRHNCNHCDRRSHSAGRRRRCPAEGNEVESGGEGGRGANLEVVAVAVRDQHVVALLALRKERRSGSVGRADAGQTRRRLIGPPMATIASFPGRCEQPRGPRYSARPQFETAHAGLSDCL